MRNRYVLFVVLCACTLGLTGCRPKGILHSWEMREVLVDLHKTDALLQVSGLQYGHNEALDIYYAQVLEKHGSTQAQFDSSIVWYTAHPLLFDKIYPKGNGTVHLGPTGQHYLGKPAWLPYFMESLDKTISVSPLMQNFVNQLFPQICIFG